MILEFERPIRDLEERIAELHRLAGPSAELQAEIARLDGLRMSATEHLLAAEIAVGRHSVVVAELESLTQRYALRERRCAEAASSKRQ